jgi:hypothetical protein
MLKVGVHLLKYGLKGDLFVDFHGYSYLFPMRWIFSNLPNLSGRTMALGSTQSLKEMSTRNLFFFKKPGGKLRRARTTDNLAAIC